MSKRTTDPASTTGATIAELLGVASAIEVMGKPAPSLEPLLGAIAQATHEHALLADRSGVRELIADDPDLRWRVNHAISDLGRLQSTLAQLRGGKA
jgi:hypothetical protein